MGDSKKSSISRRSSCYLLNLKQPDKTAKRLKLSFQRTSASVTVLKSDRSVEASVGFLDVSETGAGVFTPELLNKGTWVELCITEPVILKVKGIVAWSMPVASGVHQKKFKCRSGIQFVFDGEDQKVAVQEFLNRASSDPVENMKAAVAAGPIVKLPPGNNTDSSLIPPAPEGTPPLSDVPVGDMEAAQPVAIPSMSDGSAPAAEAAPAAIEPPANAVTEVPAMPDAPVEAAPAAPVAEAPPGTEGGGTPDSGQQAA